MRELHQIAARRLEPTLRDTHRIERLLERVDREFNQPLYADEALGLLLAGIHESISTKFTLPTKSQRHFQNSFSQHLKTWVMDALPIISCRMAMEDLMVELLQIHGGAIYDSIYTLLNDKDFKADVELKAFADSVLRRA